MRKIDGRPRDKYGCCTTKPEQRRKKTSVKQNTVQWVDENHAADARCFAVPPAPAQTNDDGWRESLPTMDFLVNR